MSEKQFVYVEATEADIPKIAEHCRRAVIETDAYIQYPDELENKPDELLRHYAAYIKDSNSLFITCRDGDKIIGFAVLVCSSSYDRLKHRAAFGVSLEKDYWNLGIGRELFERCFGFAVSHGIEIIELDVHTANKRATAIYKKYGFTEQYRDPYALKCRDGDYLELIHMTYHLKKSNI